MKTYRQPEAQCPKCKAKLDAATRTGGSVGRPEAGDASVCAYCAAVLVFTNDGTLRLATHVDLAALPLTLQLKIGLMVGFVEKRLMEERHGKH